MEARLFPLPIVTPSLAFLLGHPAKASSEERALKLICPLKESGFHLFRSVNVRTTTITIKILLFTIYVYIQIVLSLENLHSSRTLYYFVNASIVLAPNSPTKTVEFWFSVIIKRRRWFLAGAIVLT